MAVDGAIKEKKRKKKRKEDEVVATTEGGGTKNKSKYQHACVQTMIKTEQSWLNICEEEQHENDAPVKKKKKKKIKEEKSEANDLFALCCDASVQTAVKTELLEIDISEGDQEQIPQKEKKKKKKIKKESEPLQENVMEISEAEEKMDEECLVKKIKKKKKKKEMETKVEEEEIDVGHNKKIDKKKKKKRKNMEDEEQNPESEDGEVKKTRTKTEANVKEERDEKKTEKKKKTKEKNTDLTENTEALVKVDKEKKVKTKKEKSAPIEEEMNVNTEKKSKKKKRRLENLDEGRRKQNDRTKAKTGDVIGKMMSSKHKMIKNIKLEFDDVTEMEEELHDKNKSREKSDVVFLSAKSGNQDEVSIDQARRLALQKEIDKESQPQPNLGQWSTAQFDSTDKQAKFMRLMGGFKKSSQPITGSSGQANMALGKGAQQTLQQGLLGEFESAQSRHLDLRNKGIGLGFTPPSNKKFVIDVNARNSMRFDD